jgi:hypothetical protein
MGVNLELGKVRPWFLGLAISCAILGGFTALDKSTLHWYVPNTEPLKESVAQVDNRLDVSESRLSALDSSVAQVKRTSAQPTSSPTDQAQWEAIVRVVQAVTVNSLVQNYGGWQTTTSPQGKACNTYLISGQGSISDCGFQHAE